MYECACTEKDIYISNMEEIVKKCKYEYEDIQERIIVYHKELEIRAADSKHSTEIFEDAANITSEITVNSFSLFTQEKQSGK